MTRATTKICLAAVALLLLAAETAAHPPWGIAVDPQGQVYFSDLETIWKIDARGRLSVFRPRRADGGGRHTHEINVDEAGNVYGEDSMYEPATGRYTAAIWKMTPAGAFSYVLAPVEAPKGMSIWRDRGGSTYSTLRRRDTRGLLLIKRGADGTVTVLAGEREAAAKVPQDLLYGVGGMAFGADGTLYFADGASVMKLTPAGSVSPLARDIRAEGAAVDNRSTPPQTSILGLAIDSGGDVIAADLGGRRVIRITQRGEVSTLARTEGPWMPSGVAARNSDIYILEAKGSPIVVRVRKLSPDGRSTVLATSGENVAPASGASPTAEQSPAVLDLEGAGEPALRAPYVLIALAAGATAVALLIWLTLRSRAGRRLGANHDRAEER